MRTVSTSLGILFFLAAGTANAAGPIGFAAGTTGGAGGKTVTVTSFSALKTAAGSTSPTIIKVSGVIKMTAGIRVQSNKSIIGNSGATLDGAGLLLYGVKNVIIQNLVFRNLNLSDGITIKQASSKVWVDHCTFSNANYDGFVDITDGADLVTVSWSKFTGASKCSLVGGSYTNTADKGKLRVTYHHNLFYRNLERGPKGSNGTLHVFNNYYLESTKSGTYNGYGIASAGNAVVRAERNYFEDFHGNPLLDLNDSTVPYGKFAAVSTNVYKNSGANKIRNKTSSTWAPPYSYSSVMIPAVNVPSVVTKGAGAK